MWLREGISHTLRMEPATVPTTRTPFITLTWLQPVAWCDNHCTIAVPGDRWAHPPHPSRVKPLHSGACSRRDLETMSYNGPFGVRVLRMSSTSDTR